MIDLKQFLAKQLNDHSDSPSGVVQPTYFEWTEPHIGDAIDLALCYIFSLVPQEFTKLEEYTVTKTNCVIDFSDACERFMGVAALQVDGVKCVEIKKTEEANSLMSCLATECNTESTSAADETYTWETSLGSQSTLIFDKVIPAGSILTYHCASVIPFTELDNTTLCEYHPLIADYALSMLYLTDSESRSNLDRGRLHYQRMKDFVELKLRMEFSLREDDFDYGERRVADDD